MRWMKLIEKASTQCRRRGSGRGCRRRNVDDGFGRAVDELRVFALAERFLAVEIFHAERGASSELGERGFRLLHERVRPRLAETRLVDFAIVGGGGDGLGVG